MKIGELVQAFNGGDIQHINQNPHLHPINLSKVLIALGYSYENKKFVWKHRRKEPLDGNVEDYIIRVLGMPIGELVQKLNRGESLEKISTELDLQSKTILKLLKVIGYVQENNQWIWKGEGSPPLAYNVLDFVIRGKTLWQRIRIWIIPILLGGMLLYGGIQTWKGDIIGDFYVYRAEAMVLKSIGPDHLLVKHNGRYFVLFGQGDLFPQMKGEYMKVLVSRNRYGWVGYVIQVPGKES
ncbi:hypothetical protein [Ammoniphilus resinae]|uniref:Uncharacterized protein n=1 Tax=Ammoniphilus resinae TaxID=861532 RepID=A0ABS4GN63_9BACL|nr:hypothetical protein [Ammoniphilus resinae]MBP1931492.1 hypothetical protein [Ammoniphilus resinae]